LIFNIQRYSVHDGPGARTTVFFKGCPLGCLWCANPESRSDVPEIGHFPSKCVKCYACLEACPLGAISLSQKQGFPEIDRRICKACNDHDCIEACLQGAIKIWGRYIAKEELWKEVKKDTLLYRNSKGGVTLSGGEPAGQPRFAAEFLKFCKERGIHTTLDTCGFSDQENLREILKYVDLVLFDLKCMDPEKHKMFTGVDNQLILQNAEMIASYHGVAMVIRVPVVPGYNDSEENMRATAQFIKKIGAKRVELLPYHRLGAGKYESLGVKYRLDDVSPPSKSYLTGMREYLESFELSCSEE